MAEFIGTFECKMDGKGRLNIPAKIRDNIADGSEILICRKSFHEPCLELFSKSSWEAETAFMKDLDNLNEAHVQMKRRFMQDVKIDAWDSTGRFLIPKNLLDGAKIDKEVVILGLGDFAEVWDKTLYQEKVAGISEQEKTDLFEEIKNFKRQSAGK